MLHHVETVVDLLHVLQREKYPASQQTRPHRADGAVYNVEKALAILAHRLDKLKIADGETVEAHVAFLLDARNGGYVADLRMLRDVEIVKDGAGSHYGVVHLVDAEPFQALCLELLKQTIVGGLLGKHPLVHLIGEVFRRERLVEAFTARAFDKHLLRREIGQQLVHVVHRAFGRHELAGADVQESHAARLAAEMHRPEEIVLAIVEHIAVDGHARSHQFGNSALHELLRQLGVLQLLADGHTLSGTHQLRKVGVQGVVRESRHLDCLCGTVGAFGKGYAENLRGNDCIRGICLIKVAHTVEQNGVGMLLLHLEILLHQRGLYYLFRHFASSVIIVTKILKGE